MSTREERLVRTQPFQELRGVGAAVVPDDQPDTIRLYINDHRCVPNLLDQLKGMAEIGDMIIDIIPHEVDE